MPKAHLEFMGSVIGHDSEGVMIELMHTAGCCHMFAPYDLIGVDFSEELSRGQSIDVEVDVADGGRHISFTMKLHDADPTGEQS